MPLHVNFEGFVWKFENERGKDILSIKIQSSTVKLVRKPGHAPIISQGARKLVWTPKIYIYILGK